MKRMETNFEYLLPRVKDALDNTNLDYTRQELSKLDKPTIFSGVGGSSVVSELGRKAVAKKNGIITINSEPRDFIYRENRGFSNVVACSYSGNNFGVKLAFLNDLKKYLLSNNSFDDKDVTYLKYTTTIDEEKSFISLAGSLIPISILMDYYLDGKDDLILDLIEEQDFNFELNSNTYEIFSGYDTSTASKYLESTMTESGIGIPVIHDKYAFCHGRSTLGVHYNNTAIYFNRNTEFDKMILEELKPYYENIIIINSKFDDQILDDYYFLIKSMYLTRYIANKQNEDLSHVNHSPLTKKVYKFHGNI